MKDRKQQQYFEEFWRDLTRYVGGLAERWRALLVMALVFAILVPCLKYVVDMSKYKTSMQALQKGGEDLEDEVFTLEEGVVKALTLYAQWQDKKEYFDKWYQMDIDGATENRAVLLYRIEAEDKDTDAVSIANVFTTMATDQALQNSLAEVYGVSQEDAKYIKDLYYFTLQSGGDALEPQKTAYITFTAALPAKVKAEDAVDAVTAYLKSQQGKIAGIGDAYSVDFVSSTMTTLNNQTRVTNQIATYKEVTTAETAFTTQYKLLKAREKDLVDEIIRNGSVFDSLRMLRSQDLENLASGSETLTAITGSAEGSGLASGALLMKSLGIDPPSFRLLYAIIGALAGMVLYAAAYTLHPLVVRRIHDVDEARNSTGLRILGEAYSYPYTTARQRFVHDEKVYKRLHRDAGNPWAELEKAAERIAVRIHHMNRDAVTMIALGKPPTQEVRQIKLQSDWLQEKHQIRTQQLYAENGTDSLEEELFSNMSPVVLVFLSGITKPEMAPDLLERLKEYEIPVIGAMFLEG